MFPVHFMYTPAVSLQIGTLAQSMLWAMAADDASQTTACFHIMSFYMYKLGVYTFDSCKSLTCYIIN